MPQPATSPSAQKRFLSLLEQDILKLDLAELDFGIYRILNYRRRQISDYLHTALPDRIRAWAQALAQSSGAALAETEEAHCYYHLHTFFSRYWDDGDFIPRARRGGSAAYAVPYNGQDTHFHWATKGSHYIKSGELFARYAYKDGAQEVRFVLVHKVVPTWGFSVPVRGFVLTTNTETELQTHQAGFTWSTAPACLLAQDLDGDYVESMLRRLRKAMPVTP